jgi:DNA-directed RNA polymerase subunit RPC12/RpoP
MDKIEWTCPECGATNSDPYDSGYLVCPNCGARINWRELLQEIGESDKEPWWY